MENDTVAATALLVTPDEMISTSEAASRLTALATRILSSTYVARELKDDVVALLKLVYVKACLYDIYMHMYIKNPSVSAADASARLTNWSTRRRYLAACDNGPRPSVVGMANSAILHFGNASEMGALAPVLARELPEQLGLLCMIDERIAKLVDLRLRADSPSVMPQVRTEPVWKISYLRALFIFPFAAAPEPGRIVLAPDPFKNLDELKAHMESLINASAPLKFLMTLSTTLQPPPPGSIPLSPLDVKGTGVLKNFVVHPPMAPRPSLPPPPLPKAAPTPTLPPLPKAAPTPTPILPPLPKAAGPGPLKRGRPQKQAPAVEGGEILVLDAEVVTSASASVSSSDEEPAAKRARLGTENTVPVPGNT
jgi:hypothetical protein